MTENLVLWREKENQVKRTVLSSWENQIEELLDIVTVKDNLASDVENYFHLR